jgi:hypothetical protein
MKKKLVIDTPKFQHLSASDQLAVLDSFRRDAERAIANGISPADRARGRQLLRRVKRIEAKYFEEAA